MLRKQRSNFIGAGSTRRARGAGGGAVGLCGLCCSWRAPPSRRRETVHSLGRYSRHRRPSPYGIDVHLLHETVETFAPSKKEKHVSCIRNARPLPPLLDAAHKSWKTPKRGKTYTPPPLLFLLMNNTTLLAALPCRACFSHLTYRVLGHFANSFTVT